MKSRDTYRVQEVSRMTGLSVRALHHYDELGLVRPARTSSGHRLYGKRDLLRLQQVVIGRELGLGLDSIQATLDAPSCDFAALLVAQREALRGRAAEVARMLAAVDAALRSLSTASTAQKEVPMDISGWFDGFDPASHQPEARQRWGESPAFAESQRRTQSYGEDDWRRFREEQRAVYQSLADAAARGVAPASGEAQALTERHRALIDHWFYPCSPALHRALGELYDNDARFRANIDRLAPGASAFLIASLKASGETPPAE